VPLARLPEPGWGHWLLVRRSVAQPDELAYYVVFGPAATTRAAAVQVAGTRWCVEETIESAKGEVGLDQYAVRHWTPWYRYITLAMLAHAYLCVLRAHAAEKGGAASACGLGDQPGGVRSAPAADRARGAAAPPRDRRGAGARAGGAARLVPMAAAPPSTGQTLPLSAPLGSP
jgi:hypothetical protein